MRQDRAALWAAVTFLLLAGIAALLSLLDWRPLEPRSEPTPPFRIEVLLAGPGARATAAPKGARIGASGKLTILSAPGSSGKALPWSQGASQWATQPQPFEPVPTAMLAGIRALFRLVPRADRRDSLITVETLTYEGGRLLLVDGCFRFNAPDGPLAVLPPGTMLGLKDGFLMAGPPGLPLAMSARIGEHVGWADHAERDFDPGSLRQVAAHCGKGPVRFVVPQSATVQQAASDALAASNFADRYGVPWQEALEQVVRCRERQSASLPEPARSAPSIHNMCGSTPPSPVADPALCPPGTTLTGGLCRTPQGHVRPVPDLGG